MLTFYNKKTLIILLFYIIGISVSQKVSYQIYASSFSGPIVSDLAEFYTQDPNFANIAVADILTSPQAFQYLYQNKSYITVVDYTNQSELCIPAFASGIAIIYNVQPSYDLQLSMDVLLGIFNGTIKQWNHSEILALNPGFLGSGPIYVISRTSPSGTTFGLTSSFSQYSPQYSIQYGPSTMMPFPTSLNVTATTSLDLLLQVDLNPMSIGYISLGSFVYYYSSVSYTKVASLRHLNTGQPITPSPDSFNIALQGSLSNNLSFISNLTGSRPQQLPSSLLNLFFMSIPGAYPLTMYSFYCLNFIQTNFYMGIQMEQLINMFYFYLRTKSFRVASQQYVNISEPLESLALSMIQQNLQCPTSPKVGTTNLALCSTLKPSNDLIYYLTLIPAGAFLLLISVTCLLVSFILLWKWCSTRNRKLKLEKQGELFSPLLMSELDIQFSNSSTTDHSKITYEELLLEEQVGSGSFSEVYRGKWMGNTVAIKRILLYQKDSNPFEEFIKETTLMSSMRHPNVVQYYGATIRPPHLYIITEFCSRGNLQSILRNKEIKLSTTKTVALALDAARGMYYLHTSKPPVLHRDLKTANLLVDQNWVVKVADFGLSRVLDTQKEMTVCGTAETCAPEVLSRNSYTEKADVYSFAIVLWEMLTREKLYPGMNFFGNFF